MRRLMLASLVVVACSAQSRRTGDGGESGTSAGGSAADAGDSANAGQAGRAGSVGAAGEAAGGSSHAGNGSSAGEAGESATGGMPGVAGEGGRDGKGGAATTGDAGQAGAAGAAGGANDAPTVAILLDGSASMYQPRELLWDAIHAALMDPVSGVIAGFESEVRFGFSVFRGDYLPHAETDPACASITSVDFALNNESAIAATYDSLSGYDPNTSPVWQTPTGHALRRVTSTLSDLDVPASSRKYIVLITDGNPNTCLTTDPQCGQDLVVKAAQDAHALGIRTLVFGTGSVVASNDGCSPDTMPCGLVHLQDVANAGAGLPVAEPPPSYQFEPCVVDGMLTADYAATGGSAPFYTGDTVDEMRVALRTMIERVVAGDVP